jgi:hypothetical protein
MVVLRDASESSRRAVLHADLPRADSGGRLSGCNVMRQALRAPVRAIHERRTLLREVRDMATSEGFLTARPLGAFRFLSSSTLCARFGEGFEPLNGIGRQCS